MTTTLLIVDFSAVFWRQWHASAGEALTFARQRTVEQVRAHAAEHTYTVVALDSPDCWRRDLWSGYKANRPPKDEAALEQMRQAQADLAALYPCIAEPRWEADDVIAHIVDDARGNRLAVCDDNIKANRSFDELVILTADKDLLQELEPWCSMFHLGRNQLVTAESAQSELGIPVQLIPDYLALVGDKSDNVLGVKGVGPKRAAELLAKHGDLGGIYAALDDDAEQFTPALRAALVDARERKDCPIDVALGLVSLWPFNASERTGFADYSDLRPKCDERSPSKYPLDYVLHWKPPTKETNTVIDEADFDDAIEAPPAPQTPTPTPTPAPAPSQPKALAPSSDWQRALEPRDTSGAYGLAKVVVNSRMFSGYGTPEAAMLVIMAGREFGLGAMASLRSFHVVEGKPTMSAQAMMARCLEHPSCKLFRVVRSKCTHEVAVVEVQRRDWSEPETYTWTLDDAKRAGLAGRPNWAKYPRDMLINRCVAEAARFTWPEVMAGVYSPDELGGVS